jgi:predicted nucleic acid-binding protein
VPEGPLVLDTSVAAAWFFVDEPHRREALEVRSSLRDSPERFVVPALFHSELLHVLARKSGRDLPFVREALGLLLRLGIRTLSLSDAALAAAARWACRGLSGYEATFVGLAEDLGGRWLTADARAARLVGPRRAVLVAAGQDAPGG